VRQRDDIERYPEANLIRYSVLPWFDFTSISHARDFAHEDSAPRITFGKITETDGRRTMPVSIHVHHALADGLQVAQFVEKFQHSLDAADSEPVQQCVGQSVARLVMRSQLRVPIRCYFRIADHSDTTRTQSPDSQMAVYRQPSNRKGPFRQDG
jgi:hypothetical protein